MKKTTTVYMVMYDITHPATLQKVAKQLQQSGHERVNYSVWIGMGDFRKNKIIADNIRLLLSKPPAEGSKLYVLPVKKADFMKMRMINGRKPPDLDYWAGDKKLLFF
jgi:CRISPR-associated endonuclease Cas2